MSKSLYLRIASSIAFVLAPPLLVWAGEITLYTHRHYEADNQLLADFTKQSGIKVNVVKSGADQLGMLVSPTATLEEMFLAQAIARGLGTHSVDHRLRRFAAPSRLPTTHDIG